MSQRSTPQLMLGACVFGTLQGLTLFGVGCCPNNDPGLLRVLDIRDIDVTQEETCWVCLPVFVGETPAHLIGKVGFAKDYRARDGIFGAAVTVADGTIDLIGFNGGLAAVEILFDRFQSACVEPKACTLNFDRVGEVLKALPAMSQGARLQTFETKPTRRRLPAAWRQFASLAELFRVMHRHPALQSPDPTGFVLRDGARSTREPVLDEAVLSNWYDDLHGLARQKRLEQQVAQVLEALDADTTRKRVLDRNVTEAKESEVRAQSEAERVKVSLDESERNANATEKRLREKRGRLQVDTDRRNRLSKKVGSAEATKRELDERLDRLERDEPSKADHYDRAKLLFDEQTSERQRLINEIDRHRQSFIPPTPGGKQHAKLARAAALPWGMLLWGLASVVLIGLVLMTMDRIRSISIKRDAAQPRASNAAPAASKSTRLEACELPADTQRFLAFVDHGCNVEQGGLDRDGFCAAHDERVQRIATAVADCPGVKQCANTETIARLRGENSRRVLLTTVRRVVTCLGGS